MDPPVRIRQQARGHGALDDLVALWSFFEQQLAGKKKRIRGGVNQLALARGGLAADASRYVFETAGLQIKVELAMIRKDEFVVPFPLEPHMAIRFGVAGQPIEGNFVRGENVVLVVDPDFAGQGKDISMLLLLVGSNDYGNTRGRCLNHFSNRIAGASGRDASERLPAPAVDFASPLRCCPQGLAPLYQVQRPRELPRETAWSTSAAKAEDDTALTL